MARRLSTDDIHSQLANRLLADTVPPFADLEETLINGIVE